MELFQRPMSRRDFNAKLAKGSALFFSSLLPSPGLIEKAVTEILKAQYPKTYEFLQKSGRSTSSINALLLDSRLELYPEIDALFKKPAEDLPYSEYREKLGVPKKIGDAKEFLKQHLQELTKLEREMKVDRSVIVAILAVESHLGNNKGRRNPVGAFVTMIEQVPEREQFGKNQLLKLLEFCDKHGFDPHSFKGSYAGAMEWAHFIPESLEWGFVDGDGDGKPNPKSMSDSMKSIAFYLQNHDKSGNAWQLGMPIEQESRNWAAVSAYNPRDNYVLAVKEISEAIDIPFLLRQAALIKIF